jgi:hypothetical protein
MVWHAHRRVARGVRRAVAGELGTLHTPNGTQMRYAGHPLYLFAFEGIAPTATGLAPTGNGNGISVDGGTFRLVTP